MASTLHLYSSGTCLLPTGQGGKVCQSFFQHAFSLTEPKHASILHIKT